MSDIEQHRQRAKRIEALAQEIRRVDGKHDAGAATLAERLMPFLGENYVPLDDEDLTPTPDPEMTLWVTGDVQEPLQVEEIFEAAARAARHKAEEYGLHTVAIGTLDPGAAIAQQGEPTDV